MSREEVLVIAGTSRESVKSESTQSPAIPRTIIIIVFRGFNMIVNNCNNETGFGAPKNIMKSPYHYGAQRKGKKRSIKTFKVNSIFRSEPSDRDPYESIILLSRVYSFSGDDQKVMLKNLI